MLNKSTMPRLLSLTPKRLINYYQLKRCFNINSNSGPTPDEMRTIRKGLFEELIQEVIPNTSKVTLPPINNSSVKATRTKLFTREKQRQLKEVGRIKKITVEYEGLPNSQTFLMNKNLSTPHDCTRHISDVASENTIIAEVNGQLWDMHKPFDDNCKLKLLTMKNQDEILEQVNRIFWRSCTMMLGAVLEKAFQDHIYVELHSYPSPNVRSGSFVYDVDIKLQAWTPTSDEMRVFSAEMMKLSYAKLPFERLDVHMDLALEMFKDNKYKKEQIPNISKSSPSGKSLTLYRLGDFVDISRGPMMANTELLGKCSITSLTPLKHLNHISPSLYRVQGVAIPNGFHLNHFAYSIIEKRAKKPNPAPFMGNYLNETNAEISKENDQLNEQLREVST